MNFRYFACPTCRKYTSAGYRWTYWELEHCGLVEPNKPVDVAAVIGASKYWHPPAGPNSSWLYEGVFPLVKTFLAEHREHGIIYVESGEFFSTDDFESWSEIE
jgi:hypothetical protein